MMLKRKQLQLKILKININSKKINVSFNSKNKYYDAEYYLIEKGLHKYFNINRFKILYTEHGKPYLDNDVYLSISHDRDIVIVALSNVPVGVDIQYYRNFDSKVLLEMGKILNVNCGIFTNFSIKEAILKLNGDLFKNINDYDINDYCVMSHYSKKYIMICVYHKYMIK